MHGASDHKVHLKRVVNSMLRIFNNSIFIPTIPPIMSAEIERTTALLLPIGPGRMGYFGHLLGGRLAGEYRNEMDID
jgi:hypothetical protein